MRPAVAAARINHTLSVRQCQTRLGGGAVLASLQLSPSLLGQSRSRKVKCGSAVFVHRFHKVLPSQGPGSPGTFKVQQMPLYISVCDFCNKLWCEVFGCCGLKLRLVAAGEMQERRSTPAAVSHSPSAGWPYRCSVNFTAAFWCHKD